MTETDASEDLSCPYCSHAEASVVHDGACPRVKSVEYFDDGYVHAEGPGYKPRVKRIEFKSLPHDFFRD